MDRRRFLKTTAIATVGLGASSIFSMKNAWAYIQSPAIEKFATPLRLPGTDIPIAKSDGIRQYASGTVNAVHYTIDIQAFEDQLLPPNTHGTTRLWGYTPAGVPSKHLGGIIVANKGEPVQITFRNKLPPDHILPVDTTLMGADGPANRVSVHLHGGKVPWFSDGGPHAWWTPGGVRGESFVNVPSLSQPSSSDATEYYYPNNQSARVMWYHDHALGTTRLNAYAGLASLYVLTDSYEQQQLVHNTTVNLPGPVDPRTHYLVFQDKSFVPDNIDTVDPSWKMTNVAPGTKAGDLWYPHVYDPARWTVGPAASNLPDVSVVPEFFGDTILVNGTAYPYLNLEPRVYRLRLLNACNARFLNPRLVHAQANALTEPNLKAPGPGFTQIGNEGGFLPAPVPVNGPKGIPLLLAPAERADVIVDLTQLAGSTLILYNDAPAPFPMGDPQYDYYPGNPDTPTSVPGSGPNTRTLLQIKVGMQPVPDDPPLNLPVTFTPSDPFFITQIPGVPTPVPTTGVTVRRLTLNEGFDAQGRLIQFLGTDQPLNPTVDPTAFGRPYDAQPTEVIRAGTAEVWEIANLTGDTHPIHFHLVNVQILNRQRFSDKRFARGKAIPFAAGAPLKFLGNPVAPDANELGWKETVRANPGEVLRVWMKFDLPAVPFTVPLSPRIPDVGGPGVGGHEFVWHCHILEHEEHDMMRPLFIV